MHISTNIISAFVLTSISMFGGAIASNAQALNPGGVVFGETADPLVEEPAVEGDATGEEDVVEGGEEPVEEVPEELGITFLKPPVPGARIEVVVEEPEPVEEPIAEEGDETAEGSDEEEVPEELGIVFVKPPTNGFRAPTTLSADMFQLRQEVLSVIESADQQVLMEVSEVETGTGDRDTYQIDLIAHMLLLDGKIADAVGALGLSPTVNNVNLNMQATFSQTEAAQASTSGRKPLSSVDLAAIHMNWNGVQVSGGGIVDVDENGMLNGEIVITATPWRLLLELQGINEAQRMTLGLILQGMSDGDTLSVPLVLVDSNLTVGPIFLTKIPPVAWQ